VSIVDDSPSKTRETMMRRKTCTSNQAFHVDVDTMLGLTDASTHSQVKNPSRPSARTPRSARCVAQSGDGQEAMGNWQCSPAPGEGRAFRGISV
jgi:hypothetical protein